MHHLSLAYKVKRCQTIESHRVDFTAALHAKKADACKPIHTYKNYYCKV